MCLSTPDTPPTEVPEADWAEQAVAADPLAEAEAQPNAVPANIAEASVRPTMRTWSSRKRWCTARTTTAAS